MFILTDLNRTLCLFLGLNPSNSISVLNPLFEFSFVPQVHLFRWGEAYDE